MKTIILNGLDARVVEVTANAIKSSMPRFELRDTNGEMPAALRETRVRVRAAIANLGIKLDGWVVEVVLPSDLPSSGDLAVACAVLAATDVIPSDAEDVILYGELGLTGQLRPVRGVLPALQNAKAAIIPWGNRGEGRLLPGAIFAATSLEDVVAFANSSKEGVLTRVPHDTNLDENPGPADLADLRCSARARRAVEIAAAGGHSLLILGAPGTGKTMIARRITTVMPVMTPEERLRASSVFSAAGLIPDQGAVTSRPFRAPHYTVSAAGMVGGGKPARPGEVSLAHEGVLFLDELTEFRTQVLADLSVALHEGHSQGFPTRALVVGAAMSCACGYGNCRCKPDRVKWYAKRFGEGPLHFDVAVKLDEDPEGFETSKAVRERVTKARAMQEARRPTLSGMSVGGPRNNSDLSSGDVEKLVADELASEIQKLGLPVMATLSALRVARTIADLAGSKLVTLDHFHEAVSFSVAKVLA